MRLCSLYLRNFRLYEEVQFDFGPNVNLICGDNARGKTSILEAIYFLMTGRSFRTAQVADLIREGSSGLYVEAFFLKHGVEQILKISYDGKERSIVHNRTPYTSSSSLLGLLQGCVLHPDDASLIKGSPLTRRSFLDLQIAQTDPVYVHYLTRYYRAMRQRNAILKAKQLAAIESWEYEMANASGYIVQQRFRVIDELQQRVVEGFSGNAGEKITLAYKSGASQSDVDSLRQFYLELFKKNRRREMDLGFTLSGPHKDDLIIAIDNKEARYFASEGQQRSCVTSLRMAEWERLKELSSGLPVMLIDDVGISLDFNRRNKLLQHVNSLGQVFLTAAQELSLEGPQHTIRL